MRAHVHDCVDFGTLAQPEAERDQRMARRQRRVVIIGAALICAPTIGRQRDQRIAERARPEAKRVLAYIGVGGGRSPRCLHPRQCIGR